MSSIIQPSFRIRSSEKRKAKARRQSVTAVQSFGFSSTKSDSPFRPNFYANSISSTIVKRYLLSNNDQNSSPHRRPPKSNKAEGVTPLFASQHNRCPTAAADHGSHDFNEGVGLFGYSCKDDASVASPLRRINGGGGMLSGLNEALPSSASLGEGATDERLHTVKKLLKYIHPIQSNDFDVDLDLPRVHKSFDLSALLGTQSETGSSKILSASSDDGHCGSSIHSTEDGTVHDDWLIEDMTDE